MNETMKINQNAQNEPIPRNGGGIVNIVNKQIHQHLLAFTIIHILDIKPIFSHLLLMQPALDPDISALSLLFA